MENKLWDGLEEKRELIFSKLKTKQAKYLYTNLVNEFCYIDDYDEINENVKDFVIKKLRKSMNEICMNTLKDKNIKQTIQEELNASVDKENEFSPAYDYIYISVDNIYAILLAINGLEVSKHDCFYEDINEQKLEFYKKIGDVLDNQEKQLEYTVDLVEFMGEVLSGKCEKVGIGKTVKKELDKMMGIIKNNQNVNGL